MENLELADWLKIAGILLGLLTAVIGVKKFLDYLNDRKLKSLSNIPIEQVAYSTVLEEFNNATPYQRKKFRSTYKDVKVKWNIEYHAIADTYKRGRVGMVMSLVGKGKIHWINFKIDFKKFPIIKSAKEGDKFYVTGLVDNVEGNTVYLKLIDIERDNVFFF